jgi:CheY-like chemotaxis protein
MVDRVIGGVAPGLPLVLAGPPGCGLDAPIEKTRAEAGPAESVELEIGPQGTTLLRDVAVVPPGRPAATPQPAAPVTVASPEPATPSATPAPPAPVREAGPGPARILLIDSDPTSQPEMVGWLEEPCELVTARDGFQGVAKLRGERPDLIVLDLVLARASGVEVIVALHQANASIPILVVTGRVERRGGRLVRAVRSAVPEGRLRAATLLASPEVGADWSRFFTELAPLDEAPAPGQGS